MTDWLDTALTILQAALGGALMLAALRLLKGPSVTDRIMALDLIAIIIVAITALSAIASGVTVMLDVAIVIALIGFVGTVAFSLFVQRKAQR